MQLLSQDNIVYMFFLIKYIVSNNKYVFLIQPHGSKADGIQGFSSFFKAEYHHCQGPITNMK